MRWNSRAQHNAHRRELRSIGWAAELLVGELVGLAEQALPALSCSAHYVWNQSPVSGALRRPRPARRRGSRALRRSAALVPLERAPEGVGHELLHARVRI